MNKKTEKPDGYWLEPGTHEVVASSVEKKQQGGRTYWLFTFEDQTSWARAYHTILSQESTRPVLTSLAAACGITISEQCTDDEVKEIQGKCLRIKVTKNGEYPKVVRWRQTNNPDGNGGEAADLVPA